jgi:hypothetical protein
MKKNYIDVTFDVRTDSGGGDPDSASQTLRHYHKLLWSKKLPNGKLFNLDDTVENTYLYHKSDLGEFFLSSDCIIHEYSNWKRMEHIIKRIPEKEIADFLYLSYTIGGSIIFPSNKINSLPTMNQERGCNQKICDRFDLTLECIKLYYSGEDSPLRETIHRYDSYFKLFKDFKGYCEYFLLQDLVSDDYSKINFFLPHNGFETNPLPDSVTEYYEYMENNMRFTRNRNERIEKYDRG